MRIIGIESPTMVSAAPSLATDQLEQAFLEEMLKYCGPSAQTGPFGGGAGEDQFASFLTQQHAAALAKKIDLGLSNG